MAIDPLFEEDHATLIAKVRLSSADLTSDTGDIIDEAIRRVRLGFFDRLGSTTIQSILATALEPDAFLTDDQVRRAKAAQCEVLWVKYILLQDLPVLFRDASGATLEEWNQEALTRETPPSQARLDALWAEVLALLSDLSEGEVQPRIKATTFSVTPARSPLNQQVSYL